MRTFAILILFSFVLLASSQYLSASQFKCMFPRVSDSSIATWMPYLNNALSTYSINTVARVRMYMAQTGHETDSYNTFSEYVNSDGTNAWCRNYEGGCRYRGRGAIQLTHRSNYARAGSELGVDFVGNPDIVATPRYAFTVGGQFWKWNNLNACSDSGDLNTCTRKINGGTNGMQDRINKYELAKRCITSLGGGGGNPIPPSPPTPPSPTSCNVPGVGSGMCQNTASACSGSYYGGYCPGADNIRCCVAAAAATSCNVPGAGSGVCQSTSNACAGAYHSGYCPGADNIRCCVATTCNVPGVGSGVCQNTASACSGSYYSGYCPGADNIRCCAAGGARALTETQANYEQEPSSVSNAAISPVAAALIAIAVVVAVLGIAAVTGFLVYSKHQEDTSAMRP